MEPWGSSWSLPSQTAGSLFAGELSVAAESPHDRPKGRASERVPIEIGAGLRQRGASGVSVLVMDLSTHGFRASTHLTLPEGADVWLRLPGLEACHAKVVWSRGQYIGCAFERPLHPAVLEMIVRKSKGK
jgi:PilZ domain